MWQTKKKLISPNTLKEIAERSFRGSIASNLGHMADSITSRFSCGGKVRLYNVSLTYKTVVPCNLVQSTTAAAKETEVLWCSIELPKASQPEMIKLLDACSIASFGYKGESVVDKSYRDACKLDPKDFMTSFQLSNTQILKEVGSVIANCTSLQAELYKLNIYAPGGFFKPHVDTPRSEKMFGSLVVCLPTQFNGGELVLRHQGKEVKYDWSSSSSNPLHCVHWAAFFSDIEHEVLPVTEGYRVTLTYNLYYGADLNQSMIDVMSDPFYSTLYETLGDSKFMHNGGVLGFNTRYSYTFDMEWANLLANTKFTVDKSEIIRKLQECPLQEFMYKPPIVQESDLKKVGIIRGDKDKIIHVVSGLCCHPQFKGADYIVFNSAKLLGIPVQVRPLLKSVDRYDYDNDDYCDSYYPYDDSDDDSDNDVNDTISSDSKSQERFALRNSDNFRHEIQRDYSQKKEETKDRVFRLFGKNACQFKDEDITWCQQPQYNQPAGVTRRGIPWSTIDMWYKAAVILIGIPSWNEFRQQFMKPMKGNIHPELSAMKVENNVESCFRDLKLNDQSFD